MHVFPSVCGAVSVHMNSGRDFDDCTGFKVGFGVCLALGLTLSFRFQLSTSRRLTGFLYFFDDLF